MTSDCSDQALDKLGVGGVVWMNRGDRVGFDCCILGGGKRD